jgi:PKD repeat protein
MRTVRTRDVSARRVVRAGWIVLAALLLALLYRAAPAGAQTQGIVITPTTATAGTPTNFTGYITTGSGFTSVTWYFSDTNTSTAGSLSGNITTVQHTFATAGNYTITVVAQGSSSAYGSQAISVTGYGNGSTGQITITPTSGSPNIPVTFVASSAVQASSATMVWAFGDPNSGVNNSFTGTVSNSTVGTATHTYTSAGTYTVTVNEYGAAIGGSSISLSGSSSITIGSGGSGTTTGAFQVTAGNGSYLGIVSQPIIFYGTAQCNANTQCSGNFNYNWTFSDGTSSGASTANRSFSKTFNNAGSFTATLAATDLTYNTTNSASQQVCVAPAGGSTSNTCTGTASGSNTTTGSGQVTSNGLTVNPGGPYSGSGGTAITFTATATTSNANSSIVSYVWSFGDGSSGTGQSTTHTYNSSGTFTVALTVTDSTGVAVTATTTAQIAAGQRKINLPQGCSNVASTFPDGTSTGTIVTNVNPSSAVLSIWEYNSAQAKFQGYLPGATQATDLPTINHLDAFFICVNAVATFSEPSG